MLYFAIFRLIGLILAMVPMALLLCFWIVGRPPIEKHLSVLNHEISENKSDLVNFCIGRDNFTEECFRDGQSCDYLNRFGNNILWVSF